MSSEENDNTPVVSVALENLVQIVVRRVDQARTELAEAEAIRNELLVQLAGDADPLPMTLVAAFQLDGREAIHIVKRARRRRE